MMLEESRTHHHTTFPGDLLARSTVSSKLRSLLLAAKMLSVQAQHSPTHLTSVVVLRVEQVAELGQKLWPHLQLSLRCNGGNEDS